MGGGRQAEGWDLCACGVGEGADALFDRWVRSEHAHKRFVVFDTHHRNISRGFGDVVAPGDPLQGAHHSFWIFGELHCARIGHVFTLARDGKASK